jgi:hypothetical protein
MQLPVDGTQDEPVPAHATIVSGTVETYRLSNTSSPDRVQALLQVGQTSCLASSLLGLLSMA